MVAAPGRGADAETAAVEIEEDGKLILGRESGHIDPGPESAGVVNGGIASDHARVNRVSGRDFRHSWKALHVAVSMELYESGDLIDDSGGGLVGGCWDDGKEWGVVEEKRT